MTEPDPQTRWEYAGFWSRLGAFALDVLLFIACTWSLIILISGWDYLRSRNFVPGPLDLVLSNGLPSIALILFWYYKAATPGKMAMGLLVVDADTGKRLRFGQCAVRCLGYYLSFFCGGLGFAWIGFDKRKQGWHDKLAHTIVVRGDREQAAPEIAARKIKPVVTRDALAAG